MENKLIVGNIKMNLKFEEIADYLSYFKSIKSKNIVICPSYIYIPYFLKYDFSVGSQNVFDDYDGCTGEVSARQLKSIGVEYAIVGHSDRRIKLNESNSDINKKVKSCLNSNLKVILCIGETLEEYKSSKKNIVLKHQIIESLDSINDLSKVIIAYEPIWSIGTNKLLNIEELESTISYIKDLVFSMNNTNIKVIYGGSINENNIETLNGIKNIDGFLIGSASINPLKFIKIIDKIS